MAWRSLRDASNRGFLDVSMNLKEILKYYTLVDGKKTNGDTIPNTL